MTVPPRIVLGMPAYNRPDVMARALESVLAQSCQDFAVIVVDDAPTPATEAIVERYRRRCARLFYEANPRRLGMVENWRKAFQLGRARFPASQYFAWVSDHDAWHPQWLEELAAALDADANAVLAYSESLRLKDGDVRRERPRFQTSGITSRVQRLRLAARDLLAGDMIYGLMRASALEQAGIFRRVIAPDRQVLMALSLLGEFRLVSQVLWYREFVHGFDLERQRRAFFPDGVPAYAWLPSQLQHFAVLAWDFAIRGRGRPQFGRLAGAGLAVTYLWWSLVRLWRQPKAWRAASPTHVYGGVR